MKSEISSTLTERLLRFFGLISKEERVRIQAAMTRLETAQRGLRDRLSLQSRWDVFEKGRASLENHYQEGRKWERLSSAEVEDIGGIIADLSEFYKSANQYGTIEKSLNECVLQIISAEPEVYQLLPQNLRTLLEKDYRNPSWGNDMWHQIGGHGGEVQESATVNEESILLFQAASDEIVRFMWGDVGLMQFWISPKALAERDWSQAQMTVEGH